MLPESTSSLGARLVVHKEIEWRNFLPDFVSNRTEVEFLMEVTGHECTVKIEQLETLSI
jgi:hypothetical protein